MSTIIDLTGNKFGRWSVLGFSHRTEDYCYYWLCVCECGVKIPVNGASLRSGRSTNCGCVRFETKVEGRVDSDGKRTGTYYSWDNMISRCTRPSNPYYDSYGGRGIKVCERWLTFSNFFEDMGPRPEGMTIERECVDGNYEPGNCKWATNLEQQQNKRNTRMVNYNGQLMHLTQAAELSGISYFVLHSRMRYGWSEEDLFKPTRRKHSSNSEQE